MDKPSCALNSAQRTIQVGEKSCSVASKWAKRYASSRLEQHQVSSTTTRRTTTMATNEIPTLTQEEREAFWRRWGWSPELPENERLAIEQEWHDTAIELAKFHGF
ncbi:hypothetical protein DBV08_00080 [Rhodococcus sp. KBW08]|nr:hypothetical protein DBV08_00080 [Rhodococcus sp. KBW08]